MRITAAVRTALLPSALLAAAALFASAILVAGCHGAPASSSPNPPGTPTPPPTPPTTTPVPPSSADPLAQLPSSSTLTDVSADLDAVLEHGTLAGACDRYHAGSADDRARAPALRQVDVLLRNLRHRRRARDVGAVPRRQLPRRHRPRLRQAGPDSPIHRPRSTCRSAWRRPRPSSAAPSTPWPSPAPRATSPSSPTAATPSARPTTPTSTARTSSTWP